MVSRELCKICFHINAVGFHVPDEVRAEVVPDHCRNLVVCLTCFARLADEKCIPWDAKIELFPVSMATHLGFVNKDDALSTLP